MLDKKTLTIFTILFVASFLVINWTTVSWMFNYKEVSGLAYDFFNPYPDSLLVKADNDQAAVTLDGYSLAIPKIGLFTPVIIATSTSSATLENQLDMGAVQYPGSVLPGQSGQIVVLGHSAPPNWPNVKHDWIFSNLEKLAAGDNITFTYNNINYTYQVVSKNIIDKGQSVSNLVIDKSSNMLTLVSCWPPGENYQRIAISAKLVK